MNIDPFSSTIYAKCTKVLYDAQLVATKNSFAGMHKEVKNASCSLLLENNVCDIAVSFDGTWLTHGHTSLIGLICDRCFNGICHRL